MSTVAAPNLGKPNGLFVLADGTLLACSGYSIRVLAPSGLVPAGTFAGSKTRSGNKNGPGADNPNGITMDPAGNVVVGDRHNPVFGSRNKPGGRGGLTPKRIGCSPRIACTAWNRSSPVRFPPKFGLYT